MPVIEHDEMSASQFDMLWTSVASMVLVLLLYLAAYGGLRHAMLVNGLLLLATAYSFGFVTLAVGHLNILSAAFSAVLIGLGIDFAIHYVATYLNLRRQGCDEESALLRMVASRPRDGQAASRRRVLHGCMTILSACAAGPAAEVEFCCATCPPLSFATAHSAGRSPLADGAAAVILPAGRCLKWPVSNPRLTMGITPVIAAAIATAARDCATTIICSTCSRDTWKVPTLSGNSSTAWTTAFARGRPAHRARSAHAKDGFRVAPNIAKTEKLRR